MPWNAEAIHTDRLVIAGKAFRNLSGFAQEHDEVKTGGRGVFRKMIERACDGEHALARLLCSDRRFFREASGQELLETLIAGSIPV
jgi:hypothetical protein